MVFNQICLNLCHAIHFAPFNPFLPNPDTDFLFAKHFERKKGFASRESFEKYQK